MSTATEMSFQIVRTEFGGRKLKRPRVIAMFLLRVDAESFRRSLEFPSVYEVQEVPR